MKKKGNIDKMLAEAKKTLSRHRQDLVGVRDSIVHRLAVETLRIGQLTKDATLDLYDLRYIYDIIKILSEAQKKLREL